jgi:hypothetical protein
MYLSLEKREACKAVTLWCVSGVYKRGYQHLGFTERFVALVVAVVMALSIRKGNGVWFQRSCWKYKQQQMFHCAS